ncbi:hypothetical protein ACNTMW_12470 [Planosporangium sp. 12N6]|uniref:hypothetical protein n=1 Tax=Planosporangium spinosum TaxID=3402278 RepID=UPI003CF8921C
MIVGSLLLILGSIVLLAVGLAAGSNAYLVGSIAASLLAAIALVVGSRKANVDQVRPDDGRDLVDDVVADDLGDDRDLVDDLGDDRDLVDDVVADDLAEPGDHRQDRDAPSTQVIPAARADADGRPDDGGAARRPLVAAQQPAATTPRSVVPAQGGGPDASGSRPGGAAPDGAAPDDLDDDEPADEPVAQQVSAADAARLARMSTEVLVVDGRPRYHLAGCVHLLSRPREALPVHEAVELGFTPCGLCEPVSTLLAEAADSDAARARAE